MNSQRFILLYLFFLALIIRLALLTATYQDKDAVQYFEDVGIAINLLEGKGYALNFTMMQGCSIKTHSCKTTRVSAVGFSCILCFRHEKFLCTIYNTCHFSCFYLCVTVSFDRQILLLQSGYHKRGIRCISTVHLPFSNYSGIDYINIAFDFCVLLRISKSIRKFCSKEMDTHIYRRWPIGYD